jgi:hypothetical protein
VVSHNDLTKKYSGLNKPEIRLVEKIVKKILKSDRKEYYYGKLQELLNTPATDPLYLEKVQKLWAEESIKASKNIRRNIIGKVRSDLEEYINIEEFYEATKGISNWKKYSPYNKKPYYYIINNDPLDILVHIKVHLVGSLENIKNIMLLEDAIEKHLHVKGFSVNLIFISELDIDDDTFMISVDPGKWGTTHNWTGDYNGIGHELMHLMGQHDEYDIIEVHADNPCLSIQYRLEIFLENIGKILPHDAENGIMGNTRKKPLHRHVCSAVGLGNECVKIREKYLR